MINLKTEAEVAVMAKGGRLLAVITRKLAAAAREGLALLELNRLAEQLIRKADAQPAFLGYKPEGADESYPAAICTSVNEVIVHGLPSGRRLRAGDLLKIDLGIIYKGFYTDTALTVGIGTVSDETKRLLAATEKALAAAIKECRPGRKLGDIGWAISHWAGRYGFAPARGLTGHGIGRELHEEPSVLNEGERGKGLKLAAGMVLAIEPMLVAGSPETIQLVDGSYATRDGALSAHFEHTVAVTVRGPRILTG